ncbi:MAG: MoaD/ThiS family protein [bacterium]
MSTSATLKQKKRKRPEPTWDLVYKRNFIEAMKREKCPLDIVDELPELIEMGYEAVPEEDIVRLNWWGLTMDKPKVGTFMVRIKVPGGILSADQMRGIGKVAVEYGKDYSELTTRQGIQLHWVRLDQLPEVLRLIQETGLTTVGGEGDTVRNITGCPVAGISKEELFDVRPLIDEAADYFYGNPDYSNLPRKHKFTIASCPHQCNAPEIHDVALVATEKDGRRGYGLRVGGGLSSTPRLSRDIGVFVPEDEALEILRVVTDAWQEDPKYRISRAKARIKFMVDDHGPEGVRKMIEDRLGYPLEDLECPEPLGEADHLGVHEQLQEGYCYAGFSVPMGWVSGEQLQRIADVVEDAGADIRFTRQQNFILGNIPEEKLDDTLERIGEIGFPMERNQVYGTSIACTSHRFCNYSVAETKGKLDEILEELDERFGADIQSLKVFMDGCPHACAHHWVGDIGLQGTTARTDDGGKIEAYDLTLRGGLGAQTDIGRPLLRRVPHDQIQPTIVRLVEAWVHERRSKNGDGPGYTFRHWVAERSDDEILDVATDGQHVPGKQAPDRPVFRVSGPFLDYTGGLDRLEARAKTVGELIVKSTRSYPALQAELITEDGRLSDNINLFLNEEDVRGMELLDTPVGPGDELVVLPALAGG